MLKNPKNIALRLLLGKEAYYRFVPLLGEKYGKPIYQNALSKHMKMPTDIHEHLMTLYMLTVQSKAKTVVELGTRSGESTLALLFGVKETHGKVFSLDIATCDDAKKLVMKNRLDGYWKFLKGDDLKQKWNKSIDHLFIDSSHTYQQTLSELKKYEPYVKRGGVITMHDPFIYGVKRAVVEYFKDRRDIIIYQYFNNNGLFVIFKN